MKSSQQLEVVSEELMKQSENIRTATRGIVTALEEPGKDEAIWEDGNFKGWKITREIATRVNLVNVDEHGRPVPRSKFGRLRWRIIDWLRQGPPSSRGSE
jgi:hypothetical protein